MGGFIVNLAFKAALDVDDLDKALTFFADIAVDKYAIVLEDLEPEFKNMVDDMGILILISSEFNITRYKLILYEDGGVISAFPVNFCRDEYGNWKIYCF